VTTVSPPPNWYVDPTGRHETRYWDGFTWTAHVADGATSGVDPLVQPAGDPAARTEGPVIGPGTAQLQAIAETRRVRTRVADDEAAVPVAPVRRRIRGYEVAVVAVVAVVALIVGYGLWHNWSRTGASDGPTAEDAATWAGSGYRIELPPSWVEREIPASLAALQPDAAFVVIDAEPVIALVGPEPLTRTEIPNRDSLAAWFAAEQAAAVPSEEFTATVTTDVLSDADPLVGRGRVDQAFPDGITVRSIYYIVVGRERSFTLVLSGSPNAVARHEREALATVRSVVGLS